MLKAQYWQESRLDPSARSPVGAEGVAQFMPATWSDAIRALNYPKTVSRKDAALAIEAGAWYMRKQRAIWKANRTALERHDLALASYNAGAGSILKAQELCNDARMWIDISGCLPRVTGDKNARETLDYVVKINGFWQAMELR